MRTRAERSAWVSYLRVSTVEQADRELSLPAQRRAVEEFAARHGATIAREYVEAGCSGANPHRPVFRRMLEDVLRPGSDVETIVVHHTSRFTRNSTEARVVKSKLRRIGVRVVSTSHELTDDPIGKLMEGLLECFDQYESEINGVRTAAAMAEAVRQGYFPGARTPFGYRTTTVEPRPGLVRHVLEPVPDEVGVVREIYRLYIALGGAKAVARELNQRAIKYRTGVAWTKDLVLHVIEQTAAIGTYYWGKRRANRPRPRQEWLPLVVTPVVDRDVYELAQRLRRSRDPSGRPGRAAARQHLLTGKLLCGRCGASYQLETSGKRVDDEVYRCHHASCDREKLCHAPGRTDRGAPNADLRGSGRSASERRADRLYSGEWPRTRRANPGTTRARAPVTSSKDRGGMRRAADCSRTMATSDRGSLSSRPTRNRSGVCASMRHPVAVESRGRSR